MEARFALLGRALEEQVPVSVANGDVGNDLLMSFIRLSDGAGEKQLSFVGQCTDLFSALACEACLQQPEGRLNAEGRMLSGDVALARKEYEKASKIFLSISLVFDDPVLTPQALEKAYIALQKSGNEIDAKKTLNKLQSQYSEYKMKLNPSL